LRQHPWLWVLAGFVAVLSGIGWYISRVNSSHPALWAMTGGDSAHRSYSKVPLPQSPKLLWSYALKPGEREARFGGDLAFAGPVVWQDGTAYVGFDSKVHAVKPDGKMKWAWESKTAIISLALGRQGTLYALADGMLYALSPDGTLEWQTEVDVDLREARPLVVGQGGVIYVSGREYLMAVSSTGERKWRFQGKNISAAPAELSDGKLAVLLGNELYLLSRNGDTLWHRETVAPLSPLGLATDGDSIYVYGTKRVVIDRSGNSLFQAEPTQPASVSLGVGRGFVQDGIVRYDAKWDQEKWSRAALTPNLQTALSLVDGNGNAVVFAASGTGRRTYSISARLLDAAGQQKWELPDLPSVSSVAAGDGRLYFIGFLAARQGTFLMCYGDR